jgi:DNA-binding PadR family transcriptional regulator
VDRVPTGQQLKILTMLAMMPNEMTAVDMMHRDPTITEGTIYALLMRLEQKGFVTSRREAVPSGRGRHRRYYKITGHGARAQKIGELAAQIEPDTAPIRIKGGVI